MDQVQYEPTVKLAQVAVSDATMEVLAKKALASEDVEFRSHVQLLLGRFQAAIAKQEAEARATETKKAVLA